MRILSARPWPTTLAATRGALERVADLHAFAVAEHQDLVELDLAAGFGFEQLDAERFALHHAVLLTAGGLELRT